MEVSDVEKGTFTLSSKTTDYTCRLKKYNLFAFCVGEQLKKRFRHQHWNIFPIKNFCSLSHVLFSYQKRDKYEIFIAIQLLCASKTPFALLTLSVCINSSPSQNWIEILGRPFNGLSYQKIEHVEWKLLGCHEGTILSKLNPWPKIVWRILVNDLLYFNHHILLLHSIYSTFDNDAWYHSFFQSLVQTY